MNKAHKTLNAINAHKATQFIWRSIATSKGIQTIVYTKQSADIKRAIASIRK